MLLMSDVPSGCDMSCNITLIKLLIFLDLRNYVKIHVFWVPFFC